MNMSCFGNTSRLFSRLTAENRLPPRATPPEFLPAPSGTRRFPNKSVPFDWDQSVPK
jgi:hypothetical protein